MNPGALFGIGKGHTEVFLIASALALLLVLWMFAQSDRRSWLMHVALGAILAGALGNMYDRINVQLVLYGYQTPKGQVVRYYEKRVDRDAGVVVLHEYPPDDLSATIQLPIEVEGELGPVDGHVRDFIKIPTRWFGEREMWPWVFNVADMLLVGGVAVLALRLFTDNRQPQPAETGDSTTPTPAGEPPVGGDGRLDTKSKLDDGDGAT